MQRSMAAALLRTTSSVDTARPRDVFEDAPALLVEPGVGGERGHLEAGALARIALVEELAVLQDLDAQHGRGGAEIDQVDRCVELGGDALLELEACHGIER